MNAVQRLDGRRGRSSEGLQYPWCEFLRQLYSIYPFFSIQRFFLRLSFDSLHSMSFLTFRFFLHSIADFHFIKKAPLRELINILIHSDNDAAIFMTQPFYTPAHHDCCPFYITPTLSSFAGDTLSHSTRRIFPLVVRPLFPQMCRQSFTLNSEKINAAPRMREAGVS